MFSSEAEAEEASALEAVVGPGPGRGECGPEASEARLSKADPLEASRAL